MGGWGGGGCVEGKGGVGVSERGGAGMEQTDYTDRQADMDTRHIGTQI